MSIQFRDLRYVRIAIDDLEAATRYATEIAGFNFTRVTAVAAISGPMRGPTPSAILVPERRTQLLLRLRVMMIWTFWPPGSRPPVSKTGALRLTNAACGRSRPDLSALHRMA